MQSRLEVVEKENTALRQKDSMNADAIANLSDRLHELTAKVRKMENIE
jgi:predicted nuclease with TOPRIM domain